MTTTTSHSRHAEASRKHRTVLKLCLYAAIVTGAVLGIPPFVRAAQSLVGSNINEILNVWLSLPFATGMTKLLILSFFIIGLYGVWTSRMNLVYKGVGSMLVGGMIFYVLGMSPESIAILLLSVVTPILGTSFWALINTLQIKMLTLYDDDDALKKLFSKMRPAKSKTDHASDDGLDPLRSRIAAQLSRDRVGESLAFYTTVGIIGYLIEGAVNIFYADGFMKIDWAMLLQPGGLFSMFFSLLFAGIMLLFTISSIEFCVVALQKLDDLTDAIES